MPGEDDYCDRLTLFLLFHDLQCLRLSPTKRTFKVTMRSCRRYIIGNVPKSRLETHNIADVATHDSVFEVLFRAWVASEIVHSRLRWLW